jgi:hypothetical protein
MRRQRRRDKDFGLIKLSEQLRNRENRFLLDNFEAHSIRVFGENGVATGGIAIRK